MVNKKTHQEE